jgi:protein SCO1/2
MSRSLAAALVLFAACERTEPLPELGTIPELELVDQRGDAFRRSDLRGKISIVDFVFTTCPTICPLLSARMKRFQDRFADAGDAVQLVSISVDPDHDTPEVMRAYGERYGADPARWRLLTGDANEVNRVVVRGFRVAMGEPEPVEGGGYDIMHSSHFVLVDRDGVIRGYYENDEEGAEALLRDVERLRAGG